MKKKQEAEPMFKLTARLPETLVERVKISAIRRKVSLQDAVAQALEEWLKEDRR
jgi:predicted HicB family RNase H-like nuclease